MNPTAKAKAAAVAVILSAGGAFVADETQRSIPLDCDLNTPQVQSIEAVSKTYRIDEGFLVTREMTKHDLASIKGCEIAKKIKEKPTLNRNPFTIQIVDIEPLDGGVSVFARVWRDGKQIGFGNDGTVDIERFRIYNPPVLVADPSGTIERTVAEFDDDGNIIATSSVYYREDPLEAMVETIEHNLSVMKNIHDDKKIVRDKRGRTTSTFYASFDGQIQNYNPSPQTFLQKIDDTTGSGVVDLSSATYYIRIRSTSANACRDVSRAFFNFDTSAIGSDTISAATQSFYGYTGTANTLGLNSGSEYLGITSASPASPTTLTTADYNQVDGAGTSGGTLWASSFDLGSTFANWSTSGYNDFAYNASGISGINTTGITETALRFIDDVNVSTPSASNSADSNAFVYMYFVDNTGTTNDPKLVVEHSAAASARRMFLVE